MRQLIIIFGTLMLVVACNVSPITPTPPMRATSTAMSSTPFVLTVTSTVPPSSSATPLPSATSSPTASATAQPNTPTSTATASATFTPLPPTSPPLPSVTPVVADDARWAIEASEDVIIAFAQETSDGGFILAGSAEAGLWVAKLNPNGSVNWQNTYGSGVAHGVQEMPDGGYLVVGHTLAFDASAAYYADLSDALVLRLDAAGNVLWAKVYGSPEVPDVALALWPLADGTVVLGGLSTPPTDGWPNGWVTRLNTAGEPQWQGFVRRAGLDVFRFLQPAPDGGFWLAGYADQIDVPDVQVARFDAHGQLLWLRVYAREFVPDDMYAFVALADGGFAFAGFTVGRTSGQGLGYVVRADAQGAVVWKSSYGRGACFALLPEADGTLLALCGDAETKIVRLDAGGGVLQEQAFALPAAFGPGWGFSGAWPERRDLTVAQLGQVRAGGYWLRVSNRLLRLDAAGQLPGCALQLRRPALPAVVADLLLASSNGLPNQPSNYAASVNDAAMEAAPAPVEFLYQCVH